MSDKPVAETSDNTQHSQQTNIHDSGVIRTHNLSRQTVTGTGTMSAKGKAVPLEAWSNPEGSRTLRFPDFMTTAQDGGKAVSLTHRPPLPPGNAADTHFC